MIEKDVVDAFRLIGQIVHLTLNPTQKAMVTSVTFYADTGCQFELDYLNADGEIRTGKFFRQEFELGPKGGEFAKR